MKICDFIWDFDGTLLDTYPHSTTAFFDIMRPLGVSDDFDTVMNQLRFSFGSVKGTYGMSDELFDKFLNHAYDLWFEPVPVPYDGIGQVLKLICDGGGRNFLYTHRNRTSTDYLEKYALIEYFTECITNESASFAPKPGPDVINYLVERHGLNKDSTAMVGDREIDILSGKRAGCRAILFDQRRLSPETAADVTVTDISRIADYIM